MFWEGRRLVREEKGYLPLDCMQGSGARTKQLPERGGFGQSSIHQKRVCVPA
jgi:hypothetical protein